MKKLADIKTSPRIAVWGAAGNIGQALINEAAAHGVECHGFVRDLSKASILLPGQICFEFDGFERRQYDILINAVNPSDTSLWFETFETFDYRMIDYARSHPSCVCVSISSGSVYGSSFEAPAGEDTIMALSPNHIEPFQRHGLIKLLCEQRHRSLAPLPIVDIRLFAFFTRYTNLTQAYFMPGAVNALLEKKTFKTSAADFERDFIHPSDFFKLILLCAEKRVNGCYDIYSRAPIKKSEIIAYLQEEYGLAVEYGAVEESGTGSKNRYFSTWHAAADLGYEPEFSSRDVVVLETAAIMNRRDV